MEAILTVYGKPTNSTIIAKDVAINLAQKAKEDGIIIDYRLEEETEAMGKIVATMKVNGGLDKALQQREAFFEAMHKIENMSHCASHPIWQSVSDNILRMLEEQE